MAEPVDVVTEAEMWTCLAALADQARMASRCCQPTVYAHRHAQMNSLLDAWARERGPLVPTQAADLIDRLTLPAAS